MPRDAYTLTGRTLEGLANLGRDYWDQKKGGGLADRQNRHIAIFDGLNRIPFRNAHASTMPAWGVGRVTGCQRTQEQPWLTLTQPDSTLGPLYVINGEHEVAANGFGECTIWEPVDASYETGSSIYPAFGEGWGPKPGQWTLAKYYPGYIVCGGTIQGAQARTEVVWNGINTIFGISSGSISAVSGTSPSFTLGSGSVAVYVRAAIGIASTGMTISVLNSAGSIATGKLLQCKRINGDWLVDVENC